jgi:DNA-directed RNA polymerases I and III subunit RPAC1
MEQLDKHMKVTVTSVSDEVVEFDLQGVAANFANALRRILLSEVPTMAFETVFFHQNTSIIPDEVLAHR